MRSAWLTEAQGGKSEELGWVGCWLSCRSNTCSDPFYTNRTCSVRGLYLANRNLTEKKNNRAAVKVQLDCRGSRFPSVGLALRFADNDFDYRNFM